MTNQASDEYRSEHGYCEVYIPVWNGDSTPVNLTVDVVMDREELDGIDPSLFDALRNYGSDESDMSRDEEIFGDNLADLLDAGLLSDAYCQDFGIKDVGDLESALDAGGVEVFPLY